ncbi:hydrolase [Agaricicola taiwanensis]|uniref:Hydrolase n=1 Tax=Agaricicola taiwanensis TaxID=591372 RepID=A0A8J2VKZ6_9RHOB|nr:alpha/beta hydrolase [Agaricicola taiwanensis]GGE34957.1 hydrolase [Agaricicola taiwanensis]
MAVQSLLSFTHRFEPATDATRPPVLLLHGTGGDENDLVDLGRFVAPGSALLSPRGKVLENGMPRFFRRLAEGVFDEEDLRHRTHQLADFINEAREAYELAPPVALGFSNGANIAAALLLLRSDVLAGAVLFRAMSPFAEPPQTDLSAKPVFLSSGALDPLIPAADASLLAASLSERGAQVRHQVVPTGHNLSQPDVDMAKAWLADL